MIMLISALCIEGMIAIPYQAQPGMGQVCLALNGEDITVASVEDGIDCLGGGTHGTIGAHLFGKGGGHDGKGADGNGDGKSGKDGGSDQGGEPQ